MQIVFPPSLSSSRDTEPVFHQFVIRTRGRNDLRKFLEENNIETEIHYPIPIHLQPVYKEMYGFDSGSFPISESFSEVCLSLPMHPLLTNDDVNYVCEKIAEFFD